MHTLRIWTEKHMGKLWMAAVFAFLYLPLGYLILFSFNSSKQDARFTGFSLQWYEALFKDSRLVDGFLLLFFSLKFFRWLEFNNCNNVLTID